MEGVDLQLCYHQRFGASSGNRLTGFPNLYHSPEPHPFGHTHRFVCLFATCLLRRFSHLPTGRSYPPICIKNQLWDKPFPINPKTSYRSCHRSAKEALTRQLICVVPLFYHLLPKKSNKILAFFVNMDVTHLLCFLKLVLSCFILAHHETDWCLTIHLDAVYGRVLVRHYYLHFLQQYRW